MSSLGTPSGEKALELQLSHPTPSECHAIWKMISSLWRDALSLDQFMEESAHLLTVPLAKNDGMTLWVLVEKDSIPDQRAILASCETFRKRALISRSQGEVEDVVVHGIASVFCDPKYRGKGYPKRMLNELAQVLKNWQVGEGESCVGSILYSDIGKKYYADIGWRPAVHNTHVEFPAHMWPKLEGVKMLLAEDLDHLCKEDETLIRKDLASPTATGQERIMIIPDHNHMLWHHSKEEFVVERLLGKIPSVKGVMVGEPGKRVWAVWTHRFYNDPNAIPSGNVLYILRLVVEDLEREGDEVQAQLKLIFQSAQAEAAAWNLDVVKLWDPLPRVQRLLRRMEIEHTIAERAKYAIASLFWYNEQETGRPEWVCSEKYAWC